MMGTEIFKIDASWAEKLTKTRVQFLLTPSVLAFIELGIVENFQRFGWNSFFGHLYSIDIYTLYSMGLES